MIVMLSDLLFEFPAVYLDSEMVKLQSQRSCQLQTERSRRNDQVLKQRPYLVTFAA